MTDDELHESFYSCHSYVDATEIELERAAGQFLDPDAQLTPQQIEERNRTERNR